MSATLILVGASVRAAAFSARRAGFAPYAIDLFADADLRECCPTAKVDHYPEQILPLLEAAPPGPWMYTGALENYPALLNTMAGARQLYGNPGGVVKRLRDPSCLAEELSEGGFKFPETHTSPDRLDSQQPWLRKRYRSAQGRDVRPWHPSLECSHADAYYYQHRLEGMPCGAIFVAVGNDARLLGVSRQLIGTAWTSADPFEYCGSIGPLPLSESMHREFCRLGEHVARRFNLVGLFNIDVMLQPDAIWTLEVNPRYTASVEVLERALDFHAIHLHVAACSGQPVEIGLPRPAQRCCGKAVVYAHHHVHVGESFVRFVQKQNEESPRPQVADVPHIATRFAPGMPVATVLAEGNDLREVEHLLRARIGGLEATLEDS